MSEDAASNAGVRRVDEYHWRAPDGTEYRLTKLPSDPCHKCGREIPEKEYCYFRESPKAGGSLDHVCWDCGKEVTDFGDE